MTLITLALVPLSVFSATLLIRAMLEAAHTLLRRRGRHMQRPATH